MTKIVFFAKKVKNLMVLWRFKIKLDLVKILQGVFLDKNTTFLHYYNPFFAKNFF